MPQQQLNIIFLFGAIWCVKVGVGERGVAGIALLVSRAPLVKAGSSLQSQILNTQWTKCYGVDCISEVTTSRSLYLRIISKLTCDTFSAAFINLMTYTARAVPLQRTRPGVVWSLSIGRTQKSRSPPELLMPHRDSCGHWRSFAKVF